MVDRSERPLSTRVGLSARLLQQLGAPSSTLRAVVERFDAAVVVHAGGEVDASNDSTWRRLLVEAAAAAAPDAALIVDLAALKFVSCSALEALSQQSQWCRRHGVQIRLVTEQSAISLVVTASAHGSPIPTFPSVGLALGHEEHVQSTV